MSRARRPQVIRTGQPTRLYMPEIGGHVKYRFGGRPAGLMIAADPRLASAGDQSDKPSHGLLSLGCSTGRC